MTAPVFDIVAAMDDPAMLGPYYGGPSWDNWKTVMRATHGLAMTKKEREFFRTIAEREPPKHRVKEAWFCAGRGAGKDSIISGEITFAAATFSDQHRLRPGEKATILCLACDREQSKIILNYTRAFFTDIPALAAMVTGATDDGFELDNNVNIIVGTNSFRAPRGLTFLRVVLDEVAFYLAEGTSRPDTEVYNALRPGLRLPSSQLIAITTPYRRAGLLWKKFKAHYGTDDDSVLVIKAPTTTLNPLFDRDMIERAMVEDPVAASAEYLATFRDDLESYVGIEAVEACIVAGRVQLPPVGGVRYFGFLDAAGGGGGPTGDSFTRAVAHRSGGKVVLDAVREVQPKPSFSPQEVIEQTVAPLFKAYRIHRASCDRWGGNFPVDICRQHGITLEPARPKSELYQDFLSMLNSRGCELLDHARLKSQLLGLERSVRAGGHDVIDHGRGMHDDVVNAAVGAMLGAAANKHFVVTAEHLQHIRSHDFSAAGRASRLGERAALQLARRWGQNSY